MKKRLAILALILCACMSMPLYSTLAHDRPEHDEHIERILFGSKSYKLTHPAVSDIIQSIQNATYLAVDQYNGKGQIELNYLLKRDIPNIPSTISDIDFTGNYAHRVYTHKGWNLGNSIKGHWLVRKQILMNTVKKELFTKSDTLLSWFPWASEQVFGTKGSKQQQESFSILLYYIHIIGDHLDAKKHTDLAYVYHLFNPNDRDNPGIIPELLSCFEVLFESQSGTFIYINFMQELDSLESRSSKLRKSTGGINSDERFEDYHKCAEDLFATLERYVPRLLKNEKFFYDAFIK